MSSYFVCPVDQEHGVLYNLPGGKLYCPHSDHDKPYQEWISPFFTPDLLTAVTKNLVTKRAKEIEDIRTELKTEARIESKTFPITESRVVRIGKTPKPEIEDRTCAVCFAIYAPGTYSAHKNLESHKKLLVLQPK